jgi:hypothetical protein
MNHVRFMIGPEFRIVQDRVQDKALNLKWFRGGVKKEKKRGRTDLCYREKKDFDCKGVAGTRGR